MSKEDSCVLQDWMCGLSWKEQTVVLCALRGPDMGGSSEIKAITRWIRRSVLKNAAPNKTFMAQEAVPSIMMIERENPIKLDMLSVHFVSHLMHACQIIGTYHPDEITRSLGEINYRELCDYLHVNPETRTQMRERLKDEV